MLTRARRRRSTPLGRYEALCWIGAACSTLLWQVSVFIGWQFIHEWDHAQSMLNKVAGNGLGVISAGLFAGAVDRRRQGRRSPLFGVALVLFIANAVTLAASLNDWV